MDKLFLVANLVALAGWLQLFLSPLSRPALIRAARLTAALLCIGYFLLFLLNRSAMASLARDYDLGGIGAVFGNPATALLAWVHILAFDLWLGSWQAEEGNRIGISHWALIPCFFLTWAAGPLGLLTFLAIRLARMRKRASASA